MTFYEVEEALYKQLVAITRGIPHANSVRVTASRPIILQALVSARLFGLHILDVGEKTVDALASHEMLARRAVRAADGLHIVRAMHFDADLVLATDANLLALDGVLTNLRNRPIRCCDTDTALTMPRQPASRII